MTNVQEYGSDGFQESVKNYKRLKYEDLNDEGVVALTEAIIQETVKEYKAVVEEAKKFPKEEKIAAHYWVLVDYFNSEGFHAITLGNGTNARERIFNLYGKMPDEYLKFGKKVHEKMQEEKKRKQKAGRIKKAV